MGLEAFYSPHFLLIAVSAAGDASPPLYADVMCPVFAPLNATSVMECEGWK